MMRVLTSQAIHVLNDLYTSSHLLYIHIYTHTPYIHKTIKKLLLPAYEPQLGGDRPIILWYLSSSICCTPSINHYCSVLFYYISMTTCGLYML